MGEVMVTDEEFLASIEKVIKEYSGSLDDLNAMVGLLVVGRFTGWKVQRFVAPRRHWSLVLKWFGDPRTLIDEEGPYFGKSVGMKIVEKIGGYWDIIKGTKSRDEIPKKDRKMMKAV